MDTQFSRCVNFYNNGRLHSGMGYITPREMNKKCMERIQKALNLIRQYYLQLGDLTEKRKELCINKSTLWYQQKKIKEGRTIKVYNKARVRIE
jgi:hypothetical protein